MDNNAQIQPHAFIDFVFAWICVAVGYLFCRAFPAEEYPLGTFLVFALAVSATAVILIKRGCRLNPLPIVFAVASVVFSAAPVFTMGEDMAFWSVSLAIFSYCFFVYSATGNCLEKGFSNFIVVDFFNAAVVFPLQSLGKLVPALFSGGHRGFKIALKVVLGICCGFVPTVIVASLLAYDDNFNQIMTSIFEFLFDFKLFSHIGSLILGGCLAMLLFGLYHSSVNRLNCGIKAETCRNLLEKMRVAPCLFVGAAVFPLLAVYSLFFVSQADYYLSAFSGVLPEGMSYAAYAREGFFQLCQVSGINLFLLSLVSVISRRDGRASETFLKTVRIILSVVTLVLIATAMSKMVLYIRNFGLTEKRILASWLMVVIAIVFVIIILKQLLPKIKTVGASACVALLMFAVLAFSNYSGVIANYNVDKYISGDLETVDIGSLWSYGDASVPAMVRLAEHYESKLKSETLTSKERAELETDLNHLSNYIFVAKKKGADGIFGISVPYIRALNAYEEYKE